jgi:Cu/Ag efflux protein CusF
VALAASVAPPVVAQTSNTAVSRGPDTATVAQTVKVTTTITAIDAAARAVTLKGPRGREVMIVAGPEVKNFAQLKVGDQVDVEYVEAITLDLKKGGGMPVARTEQAGAAGAKAGQSPAGVVGRQVTVVANVVATDPATQMVTLQGPQRTLDIKVRDPEQFKRVQKGDQVEATYTEALALKVEPSKAK